MSLLYYLCVTKWQMVLFISIERNSLSNLKSNNNYQKSFIVTDGGNAYGGHSLAW